MCDKECLTLLMCVLFVYVYIYLWVMGDVRIPISQ